MFRLLMAACLALGIAAPSGADDRRRPTRPADGGAGVSGAAEATERAPVGSGIIRDRRDRPHRPRRWYRPPTVIYIDRTEREPAAPTETPPTPAPPPAPPETEEAEPLDPRGTHRRHLARGAEVDDTTWRPGQVLPPDMPYVKLSPEAYGLPEPPQGRIYARIGRDVLIIDPVSRVIEEVVEQ